eukprot:TRINITY_DN13665_c0_g1_i4.p2 TRINITY_DN13665_c0_g1~~TRINITY_DN13665_c0_g1_i4.p2  ORF type:complete len:242 (+),score=40.14 TRINITY_DN13665_c0_g1_i4:749-1474(+)
MVNSTWTHGHITKMWGHPASKVYPPCNVRRFAEIPLGNRDQLVISIAQFRPEKDHALQIKAFAQMIQNYPGAATQSVRLELIGSVRNSEDQGRVDTLKALAQELHVDHQVKFRLNVSYQQLLQAYASAKVGLHTMWNEHFGIGVVEMMAAGVITIGHNSGGPKLDIISDPNNSNPPHTGMLATSVDEYASAMYTALFEMTETESLQMCQAARESSARFSDESFNHAFMESINPLLPKTKST